MSDVAQRYAEFRKTVIIPADSMAWSARNPLDAVPAPAPAPLRKAYPPARGTIWERKPKDPSKVGPKAEGPRAGEIRLKDWVASESDRRGVAHHSIYKDISRGRYPGLKLRRENSRVVFVQCDGSERNAYTVQHQAAANEIPLKSWVTTEAQRLGLSEAAIYLRIKRDGYPGLEMRRVNRRVVFVQVAPKPETRNPIQNA